MDRFAEKQAQIDQRREQTCACYPALWFRMIAEWNSPGPEDRAWLMYSANYLFRTNNVRWAIDPLTLNWMLKAAPRVNSVRDLSGLSFVLLTHSHKDHLDANLVSELRHLPIRWIVPEFLLPLVTEKSALPRENIIVASPLEPIEISGIRLLPFDGLHWESEPGGTRRGVPALGYLIECKGKRWLFPGDTRLYDSAPLLRLGSADVVFAHLWLGRGSALADPPPLLEAFCQFHLDLGVRQIVLSHLHEFGRDANDFWDDWHVQFVCSKLRQMSVNLPVAHLIIGNSVLL